MTAPCLQPYMLVFSFSIQMKVMKHVLVLVQVLFIVKICCKGFSSLQEGKARTWKYKLQEAAEGA